VQAGRSWQVNHTHDFTVLLPMPLLGAALLAFGSSKDPKQIRALAVTRLASEAWLGHLGQAGEGVP
jgi:hypothetical protein